MQPPSLAVRQPEGEACHCRTEVGYDLLLLPNPLGLVEVTGYALQVGKSHLQSDPVRMVWARVLQQVLYSDQLKITTLGQFWQHDVIHIILGEIFSMDSIIFHCSKPFWINLIN